MNMLRTRRRRIQNTEYRIQNTEYRIQYINYNWRLIDSLNNFAFAYFQVCQYHNRLLERSQVQELHAKLTKKTNM